MAFDFPNSPSTGQRVTGVGGVVYVWDGVKWTSSIGNLTVQSMGDIGRNLIHNPLFDVTQRGTGPFTVGGYTADRWVHSFVGGTLSTFVISLTIADKAAIGDESATNALQATPAATAGAGDLDVLVQYIESASRLSNKTVTVSFWAAAGAGTPKLGVNLFQLFGTGGSPSPGVWNTAQSITLGAWKRYSLTFNVPSVSGKAFGTNSGTDSTALYFWLSSGATNNAIAGGIGVQSFTLLLWGVQLEIGGVATPLEKPDPRYDLSNCQRFYQSQLLIINQNTNSAGTNLTTSAPLMVHMRAVPTLSIVTNSCINLQNITMNPAADNWWIGAQVVASGTYTLSILATASADL